MTSPALAKVGFSCRTPDRADRYTSALWRGICAFAVGGGANSQRKRGFGRRNACVARSCEYRAADRRAETYRQGAWDSSVYLACIYVYWLCRIRIFRYVDRTCRS